MFKEATIYARMPGAILAYLRAPRGADALETIRLQFEQREARFLDTLRRTVFSHSANPYQRMFQLAGCGFEDVAQTVKRHGLEASLEKFRQNGIYLAHDEFKGRQPIVRSGERIPSGGASFVNPLTGGGLIGSSSGSHGRPVRTAQSIDFMRYYEAQM